MATDIIARALATNGGGGGTADAYTKAETNFLLATKANANETYTKTEVDTELDTKLDVDMSNIGEDGIAKVKEIVQPELDKKADKITVETVTSDANVVTVPENVKDFGMVSMVGGKTVKTKNLFIIKDDRTGITNGVNYTISDGVVSVSGTTEGNAVVQMLKEEIYISEPSIAYLTDSNIVNMGCAISYFDKDSTTRKYLNVPLSGTAKAILPVGIIVSTMYLQNNSTGEIVSGSCKPMIVKGLEKIPYEPYFDGLRSAPVESVVSTTEYDNQLILGYTRGLDINTFTPMSTRATSNVVPINNEIVYYNAMSKTGKPVDITFQAFTSDGSRISDSGWKPNSGKYILPDNTTQLTFVVRYSDNTTPVTNDIVVHWGFSENLFKNTVSVPQEILNLPDYGCSAGDVYNYIDFEEMVYHHKVGKGTFNDLGWKGYDTNYWSPFADWTIPQPKSNITYNFLVAGYNEKSAGIGTPGDIDIASSSMNLTSYKTYANVTEFKEDNKDTEFVYELAEEELIPIPDIFTILPVEANGTIEFVNEHNLPVPNTVKYQKGAE